MTTQPRKSQIGSSSPLADGAQEGKGRGSEASRVGHYAESRDRADIDSTSRLSCVGPVCSLPQPLAIAR